MHLLLIRHGESESNAGLTTCKDSHLTPLGKSQATRAAEALRSAGIEKIYCSPQQRGLETADILGEVLGLQPEAWVDIAERGFSGPELGISRSEMSRRFPGFILPQSIDEEGWARHWDGEDDQELTLRMSRAGKEMERWALERRYAMVACVIHGTSGTALLRYLLRVDPFSPVHFRHQNCGMTRIEYGKSGSIRLNTLNDTAHLAGLPESSRLDADVLTDGSEKVNAS